MTYDGTRDAAAEVAEDVCRVYREGKCRVYREGKRGVYVYNGVPFELTDVARCSEAVREFNEAAAGRSFHGDARPCYFGGTARETESLLKAAGRKVTVPSRGDIVCFNAGAAGEWGHIGLYLGHGKFAENTSSKVRGPGFVISSLADMTGRVSGYYSILPPRAAQPMGTPIKIIDHQTGDVLAEYRMVANGNHLADQQKVYVTKG